MVGGRRGVAIASFVAVGGDMVGVAGVGLFNAKAKNVNSHLFPSYL